MIEQLHQMGVRSNHAYIGGFVSIGLTWLAWTGSRMRKSHDRSQADRWGIFVGHWVPTMFTLGLALRQEERADWATD